MAEIEIPACTGCDCPLCPDCAPPGPVTLGDPRSAAHDPNTARESVSLIDVATARGHEGCSAVLRDGMAARGIETNVSIAAPIVAGPYTGEPFVCPHGTRYWLEPTGEQVAAWARDGVR